ncbi:tRNA preQ1(34) S-adenosylmethionine ribosyltransferase-isomerase QueA [Limibacillus sp. MBR-115]|jgi:S-adenosylmethionine:tRNA ribosyltransferase-isomerase|uniref:tRNA preQ1(34) S-adenosylmethionine ribosyltransferase-isomerase QueA n=1 Tax=Limibacillus sp. MBR-115 TaxID=3156465 RepID=UPI0033945B10
MHIEDFDFELPRELIAQRPAQPRESARLLEVCPNAGLADQRIADLPECLRPGDLLVFNDTKVIPARLYGRRNEAKVEVLLHKPLSPSENDVDDQRLCWAAFARPAKRLRPGERITFAEGFTADILQKREGGELILAFSMTSEDLSQALNQHGEAPLPPYIDRPQGADEQDRHDYQTIFAEREGAVAAPTAGLHFTQDLLTKLDERGIERCGVTLHVGAGTFLPVKASVVDDHRMHSEWGEISPAAARRISDAKKAGRRIVAVGTTSLRILETAAATSGTVEAFSGDTDLFILPGFRFQAVDVLITNFHLPRSTLFMLVSAFAGLDRMQQAYRHAIAQNYRFYSYGDACLLHRGGDA